MQLGGYINLKSGFLTLFQLPITITITISSAIECLITLYLLPVSVVYSGDVGHRRHHGLSICHLTDVYRELLEPSLINRVLILDRPVQQYSFDLQVSSKLRGCVEHVWTWLLCF